MTGRRKREFGTVIGTQMDKTAVVEVARTTIHPQYRKRIRKTSKFKVHDADNVAKVGDKVEIVECRPISRTKSWRLVRILDETSGTES
jgi:small subunit ribosomal protein S17